MSNPTNTARAADRRPSNAGIFEPLESRRLLSTSMAIEPTAQLEAQQLRALRAAVHAKSKQVVVSAKAEAAGATEKPYDLRFVKRGAAKAKGQATYSPVSGAYTPAQVRTAYGVSALSVANEGQGMTIGIVDEFDDSSITADANAFSAEYALPKFDGVGGDPTLTVYKDTALASVPASATSGGNDTSGETSLDVEWAHAMAPYAKILLVEVPATGTVANEFVELLHGVQYAAAQGCQAVSLSYGYTESAIGSSNVTSQNNTYLSTGAATNTVITVSSGDYSTPLFPATSPNVVAVGGSSLYLASVKGKYAYETAWGGLGGAGSGGGGTSSVFATPTFQSANGVNFGDRSIPDVALIADPITSVSVYDSYDAGTANPWTAYGGTSLASPVFAGMVALAQQTRVAAAKPLLTSVQVNNEIYAVYNSAAYSTYFHDITLGSNKNVNANGTTATTGYSATTGYDRATGVGSPIANTFVPLLATL